MGLAQNTLVGFHRGLLRLSGGRLGSRIGKSPVLLLTTRGRHTGKVRCIPLLYVEDAGDYVLIASNGGAEKHPAWYFNLQDEPTVTVELQGKKQQVHASDVTDPEERARLWKRSTESYKNYDGYATKTDRTIPVVRLHPAA